MAIVFYLFLLLKVSTLFWIAMIKKAIINDLIQTHGLYCIERHLIYSYLMTNALEFDKSIILSPYFEDFTLEPQLYFAITQLNICNIKELENYLELLIPPSDRKLNGAFFTPHYVVEFIINEIRPKENDTNLDPSCGCGAFLIGLADYYKRTFSKSIREIVQHNIFGADILAYNIHRAKLILTVYALHHGEYLEEGDFNLYHQDSLRTQWDKQFDVVVGNPPYVKFQDLSAEDRKYLSDHWKTVEGGTFNLYFAFFELGYTLLKSSGRLGYITPNNYFTSLAGQALRVFFQHEQCVTRIIDFSHKKVFDAQTYTAITFLNKERNEAITYDRIKNEYSPEVFLTHANGSPNFIENLNVKKWRLLK